MGTSLNSLTVDEQAVLARCERTIERGLQTFYEVGAALLQIREQRLYRAAYRTFEDYCGERWGLKQTRAYQLMDAAGVIDNLNGAVILPANESQARPLARLDPEEQRLAWDLVTEASKGRGVTRALIANITNQMVTPRRRLKQVDSPTSMSEPLPRPERLPQHHEIPLSQLWAAVQNLQVALAVVYGTPLRSPVARALSALQGMLPPMNLDTIDIVSIVDDGCADGT